MTHPIRALSLTLSAALLVACGQMGPLVLPSEQPVPSELPAAAPAEPVETVEPKSEEPAPAPAP